MAETYDEPPPWPALGAETSADPGDADPLEKMGKWPQDMMMSMHVQQSMFAEMQMQQSWQNFWHWHHAMQYQELLKGQAGEDWNGDMHAAIEQGGSVVGQVWRLARDPTGCRRVQDQLRDAQNNEERVSIMSELRTHVWEAIRDKHANHVLAECITRLPNKELDFVIDELLHQGGENSISRAAKHPYGCRILQRLFEQCSPDQVNTLVEGFLVDVAALNKHKYAHFVIQHLLTNSSEQKDRINEALKKSAPPQASAKKPVSKQTLESIEAGDSNSMKGHVWELSRDTEGCWKVQATLREAPSNDIRTQLGLELKGHVWEALKCPNANHVLQLVITTVPPHALQFIVDELLSETGGIPKAARHTNGCRILNRLFEHCSGAGMVDRIVEELLRDDEVVKLCQHKYANFVMKLLLESGTKEQVEQLRRILVANLAEVAKESFGCAVLEKALTSSDDQTVFADLLLKHACLEESACSRHGKDLVKTALELADDRSRREALERLLLQTEKMKASRYGRAVLKLIQDTYSEDLPHPA